MFDWHLFELIALLKSNCNCSVNFKLSLAHKGTTETKRFVSFFANVGTLPSILSDVETKNLD